LLEGAYVASVGFVSPSCIYGALSGLEGKCRDVLGKALLDSLVVSLR